MRKIIWIEQTKSKAGRQSKKKKEKKRKKERKMQKDYHITGLCNIWSID